MVSLLRIEQYLFGHSQVETQLHSWKIADSVGYGGTGSSVFSLLDPVTSTKAAAAYKAVKSSGSDLIVAPIHRQHAFGTPS